MVEKEIGFVGDITSIQPRLLNTLVETGYLPVVASVAADNTGQALNVNADIAAGEVRSTLPSYAPLQSQKLMTVCEIITPWCWGCR
jgi:acetylglutamate kinase